MSLIEQSASVPLPGGGDAQGGTAGPLEEFSALLRQIGSSGILSEMPFRTRAARGDKLDGVAGLARFLERHQAHVLVPLELPAIVRACAYAIGGQSRELIGLDREVASQPLLAPFASASRRVGRFQLERLRPLRDERTVRRYLLAVDNGNAHGCHTVVYGLTLAVYSWPLRQGLLVYARQTLTGLAHAAARSQSMSALSCGDILDSLFARLPEAVEQAVSEFEIC